MLHRSSAPRRHTPSIHRETDLARVDTARFPYAMHASFETRSYTLKRTPLLTAAGPCVPPAGTRAMSANQDVST